jgi:hypothetical protein
VVRLKLVLAYCQFIFLIMAFKSNHTVIFCPKSYILRLVPHYNYFSAKFGPLGHAASKDTSKDAIVVDR